MNKASQQPWKEIIAQLFSLFWRFDETFDMVLPEGTEVSKTYLHFSVKDQSPVLGEGLLLGEALLPLSQIVKEDGDVSLRVSVKQTLAIAKLIIEGAIS